MKLIRTLYAVLICTNASGLYAQQAANPWQKTDERSIPATGTRYIVPTSYLTFKLDTDAIRMQLAQAKRQTDPAYAPVYLTLPKTDGSFAEYLVHENTTMSEGLAAKFPGIRAYDGTATDGSGEVVKLDFTLQGFHAMILRPGSSAIFIDPYRHLGDQHYYIAYNRSDFQTDKVFECSLEATEDPKTSVDETEKSFSTCEHRSYRLALSATGEYTTFQGGTVGEAQSAQVTTINRVNGVYMIDFAISMTIIPNNDLLIFTNAGSDPFTNGNPGSMITQNQSYVNTNIGSSNYDIGHVFGTNSGGLAGLGVVCSNSQKARGVTGSGAPVGDPFDIDYVAHEVGHQFGGPHTFRGNGGSCSGNANNSTAVEVGSGTTIMAYAGICTGMNVQAHSDAYFHGISIQNVGTFISGGSHTCPVKTPIPSQSSPTVTGTGGDFVIPIGTPFSLTGTATDPDGDVLTYCWEQMDNQNSTQPPVATATGGPNFRSFTPVTSGTRYFPSIANQLSGAYTWERLPTVARTMKFRLTVRDNEANGGCTDSDDVTLTVTASAGPFLVTYPNASGITWQGNTTRTVTWDVANTTAAPLSCALVNILLSIDGGATFTTVLAGTPNDGTQDITVPNTPSDNAIIMVQSNAQTFFDISNNKFKIIGSTDCFEADVPTISGSTTLCAGSSTTLTITGGELHDATGWRWYSGSCNGTVIGTGTSINISSPGNYFVGGFGGCTVGNVCRAFTVVLVNVNTGTSQAPTHPHTLSANLSGATYQWLDCANGYAEIPGATGQSYTPSAIVGQFAVEVTTSGCSDTSACISYDIVGLDEEFLAGLELFPNPTAGIITLKFASPLLVNKLFVTDLAGRMVQEYTDIQVSSRDIDLSKEGKGVYFLHIDVAGKVKTYKIVRE